VYRALVQPLDKLRSHVLQQSRPWIVPFIRQRDLRVTVSACILIFAALGISLSLPFWQLALGPILLGIPHVLGDIRYLVVQRGLHRSALFWFAVAAPLAMAVISQRPAWGVAGVLGASLVAPGERRRKTAMLLLCLPAIYAALHWQRGFLFAFLHLHNLVALVIWWNWRERKSVWQWLPLLAVVLGVLLISGGLGEGCLAMLGTQSWHPKGLGAKAFGGMLAPFAEEPWQHRLVILFAFLQSIHYLVWIRLIPEDARKQPTPRTFNRSVAALRSELGVFFEIFVIGAAALGIWAVLDIVQARRSYLQLIFFHGFLEFAICAWCYVERRPLCSHG
jgi:hypothetical protein